MPPVTPPRPGLGDIIGRLESATGADREIDAALWLACVEKPEPGDKLDRDMIGRWPSYTASIDAALTLVPEGAWYTLGHEPHNKPWARCYHVEQLYDAPEEYGDPCEASNQAIALCIAALKARARQPAS